MSADLLFETSPELAVRALKEEQLARHLEALAEQARAGSLAAHARLFMEAGRDRMTPARHHEEVVNILEDPETFPAVTIVMPPGYAKSSWGSVAYPSWRIGRTKGNIRIGLVSNTATQAYGFSKAVQGIVESPLFAATYDVRPDRRRGWAGNEWYVTGTPRGPNPTMLAAGIGGPIVGKRFDEIILDDPTRWEEARSPAVMEQQRAWLKNTLVKRFPAGMGPPAWRGARMVVLTTRWGENDLVPALEDLGFVTVLMPALGYWDRTAICSACGQERDVSVRNLILTCEVCGADATPEITYGSEPLWPEVEDAEQLEAERDSDELIFELVKQGNPKVLSGNVFDAGMFRREQMPSPSTLEKVVAFVDTAGGKDRRKGDYFAMAVLAKKGPDTYVVAMRRGRISAPEQERVIEEVAETFRPDLIGIEDANEGSAVYQHLNQRARLPLKLIPPRGDKEFRAIPVANAYRAGTMVHIEGAKWVLPMEAELEAFPAGPHDDQVDALSGAYNLMTEGSGFRVRVVG